MVRSPSGWVRWLADVAGGLFGVDRRAAGEDDVIEHGAGGVVAGRIHVVSARGGGSQTDEAAGDGVEDPGRNSPSRSAGRPTGGACRSGRPGQLASAGAGSEFVDGQAVRLEGLEADLRVGEVEGAHCAAVTPTSGTCPVTALVDHQLWRARAVEPSGGANQSSTRITEGA
jgi:hypothetical protein